MEISSSLLTKVVVEEIAAVATISMVSTAEVVALIMEKHAVKDVKVNDEQAKHPMLVRYVGGPIAVDPTFVGILLRRRSRLRRHFLFHIWGIMAAMA